MQGGLSRCEAINDSERVLWRRKYQERFRSFQVKCQSFSFKKNQELSSDEQDGRSIQIELVLYNKCSHGEILLKGKKVTAIAGGNSSK